MTNRISVRGATRRFGDALALDGVDLDVRAGSLTAIVGPSGSGKSTLVRAIAGVEHLDEGRVAIDGRDVTNLPPERRSAALVPQDGALFPHLDVASNVAFGIRGSRASRRSLAIDMLDLVDLAGFARRLPRELSGGQQQRVALARALAISPAVVLLDEPYAALDAHLRSAVRESTTTAVRAAGATAILVTHDQEEAISWADHLVVMIDGRVVEHGEPGVVYERPQSTIGARFLGQTNVLEAVCTNRVAATRVGELPVVHVDGPATVLVRPEDLEFTADGVRATVTSAEYYGHDHLCAVQLDDGKSLLVRGVGRPPAVASSIGVRLRPRSTPAVTIDTLR